MEIAEKTVVSLRYIMKNKEGEEIENTFSGPAVQYVHGSGKILPQLETSLTGLKTGDKKEITLELPDTFHFQVEIDDIRIATPEEMEAGNPIATNDCGPGCCC
ncbi:MAG: FKBP-type peptidyl-prolyl cis-trans isomerase [Chitinophagaceae bacterium]